MPEFASRRGSCHHLKRARDTADGICTAAWGETPSPCQDGTSIQHQTRFIVSSRTSLPPLPRPQTCPAPDRPILDERLSFTDSHHALRRYRYPAVEWTKIATGAQALPWETEGLGHQTPGMAEWRFMDARSLRSQLQPHRSLRKRLTHEVHMLTGAMRSGWNTI